MNTIGIYCFSHIDTLKLFVALKLKRIVDLSFCNCVELETVIAPLACIDNRAFYNCGKVKTVLVLNGNCKCSKNDTLEGTCGNCVICKGTWE